MELKDKRDGFIKNQFGMAKKKVQDQGVANLEE